MQKGEREREREREAWSRRKRHLQSPGRRILCRTGDADQPTAKDTPSLLLIVCISATTPSHRPSHPTTLRNQNRIRPPRTHLLMEQTPEQGERVIEETTLHNNERQKNRSRTTTLTRRDTTSSPNQGHEATVAGPTALLGRWRDSGRRMPWNNRGGRSTRSCLESR